MEALRLNIDIPRHGWVNVRLIVGVETLEFIASYTPTDSIGDLARAAVQLASGAPAELVVWNTESDEYIFRFLAAGKLGRFEIHYRPSGRRNKDAVDVPVLIVEDEAVAIARAIWRSLRRLQSSISDEAYAAEWRHRFPARTVERLGGRLRNC